MKAAFKWIGWGILGLIVLTAFLQADQTTQWGIGIIGVGCWLFHDSERRAEQRRVALEYRLNVIEGKLDAIINHPLNTSYISDGVEGLIDELRDRQRARDRHPLE